SHPDTALKPCCKKPDSEKHGCTKTTTQVFQLKTEFEVGSSHFKKLDLPKAWAFLPAFPVFLSPFFEVQKMDASIFESPPPSLSGRMRCVRQGVFRC
ncbi:MAG: hypothetical protein ACKVUS_13115, partial [Saprospiraceae bacterium]